MIGGVLLLVMIHYTGAVMERAFTPHNTALAAARCRQAVSAWPSAHLLNLLVVENFLRL